MIENYEIISFVNTIVIFYDWELSFLINIKINVVILFIHFT